MRPPTPDPAASEPLRPDLTAPAPPTSPGPPGPDRVRRRFGPSQWIPIALATIGMVLGFTVHMAFNILTALGLFGPGLLREFGLLRDRHEDQRRIATTAGHRAYLLGGLMLMVVILIRSWGVLDLDHERVSAALVLIFFLETYFLSYLFGFWGATRASFRILATFGSFWLAFIGLSHAQEPLAALPELGVPAVLFALAFAGRRWPRPTGALLLALSVFAFFFFGIHRIFAGETRRIPALLLMIVPMLACGFALVRAGRPADA